MSYPPTRSYFSNISKFNDDAHPLVSYFSNMSEFNDAHRSFLILVTLLVNNYNNFTQWHWVNCSGVKMISQHHLLMGLEQDPAYLATMTTP